MKIAPLAALALLAASAAAAQPTSGPAMGGSPAWFLQMPPPPRAPASATPRPARPQPVTTPNNKAGVPLCVHSTVCDPEHGGSANRGQLQRVQWKQAMGYAFSYPFKLQFTDDNGPYHSGVPAVGVDSKGNFWIFQRNRPGEPQLFKFDPNYRQILAIGEDVIGHQEKPHGLAVDGQDNVWIVDADGSTVMKLSPEGKLLKTFGSKLHRGDWDEARNQRLLWQPMDVAFAPNGDVYIGEGHANESPNDVESTDATDVIGAARILHFDRDGNFVNQWFGNSVGQGKFSMAHGVAVDPRNGDVWIGDREQYRIVVYTKDGHFLKTMQMRNLICAIDFDAAGNPWVASGQDGQILRIDRNGKVLGAMGNGAGREPGQAIETTYMAWDKDGNIYTGDTSVGRVTKWSKSGKKK
jgi:DNA-binding beta-propeller fold protein YncE